MEVGRANYAPQVELPFGFDESDRDDFEDEDPVYIWPENIPAALFWNEYCTTQWNHGFHGRTGLKYESIRPIIYDEIDDKDDAKEMFWAIRQIERGALTEFARQAREDAKKSKQK